VDFPQQQALSLNPRPDAGLDFHENRERRVLFEEIRYISTLFSIQPAGLPEVSAAVKEGIETSGFSIDALTVARIQRCARRVALKASLPEIEGDLALVGIEAYPRTVADLSGSPADADTWGPVQQRKALFRLGEFLAFPSAGPKPGFGVDLAPCQRLRQGGRHLPLSIIYPRWDGLLICLR